MRKTFSLLLTTISFMSLQSKMFANDFGYLIYEPGWQYHDGGFHIGKREAISDIRLDTSGPGANIILSTLGDQRAYLYFRSDELAESAMKELRKGVSVDLFACRMNGDLVEEVVDDRTTWSTYLAHFECTWHGSRRMKLIDDASIYNNPKAYKEVDSRIEPYTFTKKVHDWSWSLIVPGPGRL